MGRFEGEEEVVRLLNDHPGLRVGNEHNTPAGSLNRSS